MHCAQIISSPLENDIIIVMDYMSGGSIMEYSLKLKKYVLSTSAAAILSDRGATESLPLQEAVGGRNMTDAEAAAATLDLLRGLHYLQSRGICHRYAYVFYVIAVF